MEERGIFPDGRMPITNYRRIYGQKSPLGKHHSNICLGKNYLSINSKIREQKHDNKQGIYTVSKYLLTRHLISFQNKKIVTLYREETCRHHLNQRIS